MTYLLNVFFIISLVSLSTTTPLVAYDSSDESSESDLEYDSSDESSESDSEKVHPAEGYGRKLIRSKKQDEFDDTEVPKPPSS